MRRTLLLALVVLVLVGLSMGVVSAHDGQPMNEADQLDRCMATCDGTTGDTMDDMMNERMDGMMSDEESHEHHENGRHGGGMGCH